MTRIHLTLASTYVPDWGVQEGLRELVQNWMDACDKSETDGTLSHDGRDLILTSPGGLERAALLLGTTTKAGDDQQRGQFGEGLKLGALALVRAGCQVHIRTGNERWIATLDTHPNIGGEVLAFDIATDETLGLGVQVIVHGIDEDDWKTARGRFRRFSTEEDAGGPSYYGEALLAEEARGRIFVKGLWVCHDDELEHGYDFANVSVDRDRRLVAGWDVKWHASALVAAALRQGRLDATAVYSAAEAGAKDTSELAAHLQQDERNDLALLFASKHGDRIPVKDETTRVELDHVGVESVIVSDALRDVLEPITGTAEEAKAKAMKAPKRVYTFEELAPAECLAVLWATGEIGAVLPTTMPQVHVADFVNDTTLAQFRRGKLYVSKTHLACRFETLTSIVHEVAHFAGRDGERAHSSAVEGIWKRLAARWHGEVIP